MDKKIGSTLLGFGQKLIKKINQPLLPRVGEDPSSVFYILQLFQGGLCVCQKYIEIYFHHVLTSFILEDRFPPSYFAKATKDRSRERRGEGIVLSRLFALLFLIIPTTHIFAKQIKLALYDMQQTPVTQVAVGQPFILQVIAEKIDYGQQPKEFVGFDNFSIASAGVSSSTSNINGTISKKTTFSYVMTPEKKGSFLVGPIIFSDSASQVASEKIKIEVGDAAVSTSSDKTRPYLLETIVDHQLVYVGQKIKTLIRFCFKDDYGQLVFSEFGLPNFKRGPVNTTPQKGTTLIAGQAYDYEQISMELYPEQVGDLQIPQFGATFIPAMKHQQGIGGMMGFFGFNTQRSVQSKPIKIQVKSLPEIKGKQALAVGSFDKIEFVLQRSKAAVSEGVVASLKVYGDGNFEMMKFPELKLPQGLHSYEGNSVIEPVSEKNKVACKTFEWIVQADRPGEFAIDAQTVTFFDPQAEKYQTLKSNKASLAVSGEPLIKSEEKKSSDIENNKKNLRIFKEGDIDVINEHVTFTKLSSLTSLAHSLLSWLIVALIILTCFLTFVFLFARSKLIKNSFFLQSLRYRYELYRCMKNKDIMVLYQLFLSIEQRYQLPLESEQMKQYFKQLQTSLSFEQWQEFVQLMLAVNFAQCTLSEAEQHDVYAQAKYWLTIVLSCCKLKKRSYDDKDIVSAE